MHAATLQLLWPTSLWRQAYHAMPTRRGAIPVLAAARPTAHSRACREATVAMRAREGCTLRNDLSPQARYLLTYYLLLLCTTTNHLLLTTTY